MRTEASRPCARAATRATVPTLFSASAAVGANVIDASGEKLGVIVDLMLKRDQRGLAYVVIAQYGMGGVGETLRAVDPANMSSQAVSRTAKCQGRNSTRYRRFKPTIGPAPYPLRGARDPGALDRN